MGAGWSIGWSVIAASLISLSCGSEVEEFEPEGWRAALSKSGEGGPHADAASAGNASGRLVGALDASTAGTLVPSADRSSVYEAEALALAGTTLAVASAFSEPQVRILRGNGDNWAEEARFDAMVAGYGGQRALTVAASEDVVVVGVPFQRPPTGERVAAPSGEPSVAVEPHASMVRVWSQHGGQWQEDAVLLPPGDPSASAHFGLSIAVQGDTLIVGAPHAAPSGAAYVYERRGSSWDLVSELRSDARELTRFAWSVALDGDTIAVGAPLDPSAQGDPPGGKNAIGTGSVYLFRRGALGTWARAGFIKASDAPRRGLPPPCFGAGCMHFRAALAANHQERFGHAVALSKDLLVVGAPGAGTPRTLGGTPLARPGAAYVFRPASSAPGGWQEEARLEPGGMSLRFGALLSTNGEAVVVGAPEERVVEGPTLNPTGNAIAWTYRASAGQWGSVATLRVRAARGAGVSVSGSLLAMSGADSTRGGGFVSVLGL